MQAYPLDPDRLYAGGFSQGAAMSAALALTTPERVAGSLILSGYLPLNAELPLKPEEAAGRPVFEAHGVFDEMIPITWARQTRRYLQETPVDLTYREYPIGHWISPEELADASAWFSRVLDAPEEPATVEG